MSFVYWLNLTIIAICTIGQFENNFQKNPLISKNSEILASALLVNFRKIKNIAKCNIAIVLKKIPILDSENIAKKTTYALNPLD